MPETTPSSADCGLRVDKVMMHHIASSANVTQAVAERVVSALFAELGCVTTPGQISTRGLDTSQPRPTTPGDGAP